MFSIFKNINKYAGKRKDLDLVAIFCARYLIYVSIAAASLWLLKLRKFDWLVCAVASGLFALFLVARGVYLLYRERRPAELKSARVLIPVPKNPSFPSSHASFMFGISFFILFYDFKLGLVMIFISCIVGIARVFCGVHWMRDIVGGALAGLFSAVIINYIVQNII